MNRIRVLFVYILALSLILGLSGCGKNGETERKLGTAGKGGNYYGYGTRLSEALGESGVTLSVEETQGSAANLRLLSEGYLDFAIVQSDTLSDALNGTGAFSEKLSGFHTVTGLYTEACQVIVRAASGITDIGELAGKTVALGEENSGVSENARDILSAYGLSDGSFNREYLSFSDSAEALLDGTIDAFFVTASVPTTAVKELAEKTEIRILGIDSDIARRLLSENSAYTETVIPAGTYTGQTGDISTIGVAAVLIAADSVSEETENTILSVLKEQNEQLQEISFGIAVSEEEEDTDRRRVISLDMYMTLALAVLVLYLGSFLRKKIKVLETFCIPAPVVGGLLFAIASCVLYALNIVEFDFDETLKTVCMIMFFTSVGFQANLKILKQGGVKLIVFLVCVVLLILCQNGIAVGVAKALGLSPLVGLCTGSIPMVGGHGTAGAFGVVLEDFGVSGAMTLCTAAATFGLVAGSLMGGPVGRRLILKHDLMKTVKDEDESVLVEDEKKHVRSVSMYAPAAYQIALAMGLGTIVSMLLSRTGMTFPVYIGAMIVAAFIRNIGEYSGKFTVHMGEINDIGGICLSLFLGIAMVTLKLWQLADLALPLFILLAAQTVFMFLFSYFVVFNLMGRNYDAAVLSAGTCGFGMGATPNAMANMQALTEKFAPSVQAYILVPIVGSMFADFINSIVITFFINLV